MSQNLMTSETDESLMRNTLLKCYSEGAHAFRVSKEHYRYLAEQIISLREDSRRRTNNLFPYDAPKARPRSTGPHPEDKRLMVLCPQQKGTEMTSGPNDHAEWLRWYAEHKRFDDGTPYESHKRLTAAAAEIDRLQEAKRRALKLADERAKDANESQQRIDVLETSKTNDHKIR
jgi:hypothetical protein